jgi:hypothetical protein
MLTQKTKEAAMSSLESPLLLAQRLGADAEGAQRDVMERFAAFGDDYLEVAGDEDQIAQRAVALSALWRLLNFPGSGVVVTSPTRRDVEPFMAFLERVTQSYDAAMQSQTAWPRWNVMRVHGKHDWTLRYVSPVPAYVDEIARDKVMTVIALGARSSSPAWMTMDRKLDELRGLEGLKLVRVW